VLLPTVRLPPASAHLTYALCRTAYDAPTPTGCCRCCICNPKYTCLLPTGCCCQLFACRWFFLLMLFADKPVMPPPPPPPPVAVLAAAIPPPFPVFAPKPFTWRTKLQPKANQRPTPSVAPTAKSTPVLPPKGSQQQKPGVAPVATSKAEPPSPYYHCILQRQGDRCLSLKQLRLVEFTVHSYLPRSASTRPLSFLVQEQAA